MAIKRIVFDYEAVDKNKNLLKGEMTASSLVRARNILNMQGLIVLKLQKKNCALFHYSKSISNVDITVFTRQMATMIHAGIPIVQSLNIILESSPFTALAELIKKIKIAVESGVTFSQALKPFPKYFNELYCNLIQSGEQSGTLDVMLTRIALYQEKTLALKRKIKKALYYPTTVLSVALIVTVILLVKVIPTFQELFKNFGAELPFFTQLILNLSALLQNYGIYIFLILLLLCYSFIQSYQKKLIFRYSVERFYLKLPIIGNLIQKIIIARFARTLATTFAAGVPLTDAVDSIGKTTDHIVYQSALNTLHEGLMAGKPIHIAMRQTRVFPLLVSQMVRVGEESGTLDRMLEKIALIYEEDVDSAVDGLTTLLEPLIMIILGVVVGSLVIAMYLPIFKMGAIV